MVGSIAHRLPITPRQRQTLRFIVSMCVRGVPPTVREIAAHLGHSNGSTHAVEDILMSLHAKGYVSWETAIARSLRPTKKAYVLFGFWCEPCGKGASEMFSLRPGVPPVCMACARAEMATMSTF